MAHGFSKENQSSPDTAYRFGDFELHPRDRLLKRDGVEVPLQPRALDALQTVVKKFPKHARAKDAAKLIADLKK